MVMWLLLHTESNSDSGSKTSGSTATPSTIPICVPSLPLIKSVAGRIGTVMVSSGLHLPRLPQMTDSGIHIDSVIPTITSSGAAPFSLDPCFPPIPAKIVRKIQVMEFVKLQELHPDNISLKERMDLLPNRSISL